MPKSPTGVVVVVRDTATFCKISQNSKRISKDATSHLERQNEKFCQFQRYLGVKCPEAIDENIDLINDTNTNVYYMLSNKG